MPTYRRDGLRLHYDTFGQGPPVLCVHGATGTGMHEWSGLVNVLGDRYRFSVPDLRGHGLSDHRAGQMGIEYVVDDLLELINHEHLGRPHLLAFSFGAEVALELEMAHPGTGASLILVSPGLGNPKSSVPTRQQLEAGWPNSLRKLHTERHGKDHWLAIMVELCDRARLRSRPDPEALNAIGCPILLIVGSKDDPRRIRQAGVLHEAHDNCRLVMIEGARHAAHKDRPAEVVVAVDDFLVTVRSATEWPSEEVTTSIDVDGRSGHERIGRRGAEGDDLGDLVGQSDSTQID